MNDQTQKPLSEMLDEIESRANAASPSPWLYDGSSYTIGHQRHMIRADGVGMSQRDAAFIAAARSDVPALVGLICELTRGFSNATNERAARFFAQLLREPADSVQTKEEKV